MRPSTWMVLAVTTMLPAFGACTEHGDPDHITGVPGPALSVASKDGLDAELQAHLAALGFTGRVASTLEARLGRRIDHQLADLGRMFWFDPIRGLNDDNTCGGCHSPTNGFGDTQPIAIGIDNNGIVGPGRTGPRNQRRTPMVINTAFYPTLMWNSRFFARRAIRSTTAPGSCSRRRRASLFPISRICSRPRRSFPHRARRGGGVPRSRATTRHPK